MDVLFDFLQYLSRPLHELRYLANRTGYFLNVTRLAVGQADPWWHSTLYDFLHDSLITVVVFLLVSWIISVLVPAWTRAFILNSLIYIVVLSAAPWWLAFQLLGYLERKFWPDVLRWQKVENIWRNRRSEYPLIGYLTRKRWILWGPDRWEDSTSVFGLYTPTATDQNEITESKETEDSSFESNETITQETYSQLELSNNNTAGVESQKPTHQQTDNPEHASQQAVTQENDTHETSASETGSSRTTALDGTKGEAEHKQISGPKPDVQDNHTEDIKPPLLTQTEPGSIPPLHWRWGRTWQFPSDPDSDNNIPYTRSQAPLVAPSPLDDLDENEDASEHEPKDSKCPFCLKEICSCGTCAGCENLVRECSCPPCALCPWGAKVCRCQFCYACGWKGDDCQCEKCSICGERRVSCKCSPCFICGGNPRTDCRCHECFRCYRKPGLCCCIFNPFAHFIGPGSRTVQWWTNHELARMSGNQFGGHTFIAYGTPKLIVAIGNPFDIISPFLDPLTQYIESTRRWIREQYRQMRIWYRIRTYNDQVKEDTFWNIYQSEWVKKMMDDICLTLKDQSPEDPPVIAFDLEGINLGRHGTTCYMQIRDFVRKQTYLIDLCRLGRKAFDLPGRDGLTLRAVFEDKSIKKLIFDARQDSDALYAHYGVRTRGVVDLQVMWMLTLDTPPDRRPSLVDVIRCDSGLTDEERRDFDGQKDYPFYGNYTVFLRRPLPKSLKAYATNDVMYLRQSYDHHRKQLTQVGMKRVYEWSDRQVEETWAEGWTSNRARVVGAFASCWGEAINPDVEKVIRARGDPTVAVGTTESDSN